MPTFVITLLACSVSMTALAVYSTQNISQMPMSSWDTAGIVWAVGACISLMYQVGRHIRLVRTTRRWNEALTDCLAYELLQQLKAEARVKGHVRLYCCPCIASPMAMGMFHTDILLPHLDYEVDELVYILRHELVHVKRKDIFYRTLTMITIAVHWFNPVAYLMGRTVDALCEMSCDSEVVQDLASELRLRYSETIIGVVKYQSRLRSFFSTGFYAGKKGMKKRITSIMNMDRKRFGAALICAVLILCVGSGFALAATVADAPPASTSAVTTQDYYGILQHHESPGYMQVFEPIEAGQITRGDAIDIAEASIERTLNYIKVNEMGAGMGIASAEASIVRKIPEGVDALNDNPSPQYSFWEVVLTSPDEAMGASFFIHSMTGNIYRAQIRGWGFMSYEEISLEKALSDFVITLGYVGFSYPQDSLFPAGDLLGNTMSVSVPLSDGVFAVINASGAPVISSEGNLVDDMVDVTFEVYLTTQPNA